VQTKFAPIIHPSISNHCVGVQVPDTQIYACFWQLFQAGNSITGGSHNWIPMTLILSICIVQRVYLDDYHNLKIYEPWPTFWTALINS